MLAFRAPTLADLPAVFELLVARDLADYGRPDITLEDLRDEWSAPSFSLRDDAVLAIGDVGEIAGYSSMHKQGAMGFVAPDREGQGIGSRLIDWAQTRERALGRARHGQAAAASNTAARALFTARGYTRDRSYSRMVVALSGTPPAPSIPGVGLRAPDAQRDAASLHALDALAFSANSDYVPESLADFGAEHLLAHDFAPELSALALDGDGLAGFILVRRWAAEAAGFIDLLAVHPRVQRRGLGEALLRTAFARCAAEGLQEAQLGVASDNPRALALYRRAGMSPRFVLDGYSRPLAEA